MADIVVEASGPSGRVSQVLPDDGGNFDLNLPLTKNARVSMGCFVRTQSRFSPNLFT